MTPREIFTVLILFFALTALWNLTHSPKRIDPGPEQNAVGYKPLNLPDGHDNVSVNNACMGDSCFDGFEANNNTCLGPRCDEMKKAQGDS